MEALGIDWRLILAQIINFGLLFFLLQRFLFKPIVRILRVRQKRIAESLENAEKIKKELEEIEIRKQEEIKKAQIEGERILNEVRRLAKNIHEESVKQASDEARRLLEKAKQEASIEQERLRQELKEEVISLSLAMAKKMIAQNPSIKVIREIKYEKNSPN